MSGSQPSGASRLRIKFRTVARDRIARLAEILDQVEIGAADAAAIDVLMREIHTLKGEAHLVGFGAANRVAHAVEDLLLHAAELDAERGSKARANVYHGLDLLSLLLDADETTSADDVDVEPFLRDAERVKNASRVLEGARPSQTPARGAGSERPPATEPKRPPDLDVEPRITAPEASPERVSWQGYRAESSIRIELDRLHQLTDLAGTLTLEHDRNESRMATLDTTFAELLEDHEAIEAALGHVLRDLALADRPVSLQELAARSRGFRRRRAELRRLLGSSRDHLFEYRLQLAELDVQIRGMRLQPLDAIFREYPRATRELAGLQGKQVRLAVHGADVAVDKEVLEKLGEPLLHLVRNAVDHGIEPPDARIASGKPAAGTITLRARQRGPFVEIRISDDGHGIDVDKIRRVAVRKGVMSQSMADTRSDAEVLPVIFEPGFSTMERATDLSGRGVGLDVAKANVEMLGGSVSVETVRGEGTTFVLTAPIAMVFTRALLVGCGDATYAIPSETIRRIADFEPSKMQTNDGLGAVVIDDEWMTIVDLRTLLSARAFERPERPCLVVVEHLDMRAALLCDRLVGERPIVQRSFDGFLSRKKLLAGAAVLESGELAILLDVAEVVRLGRTSLGGGSRTENDAAAEGATSSARSIRVLVVDDSEITRDLIVSILRMNGHDVREAVNGKEALRAVEASSVDVVVTDLEMPVLDGFGLLRELRRRPETRSLPVIVFSTRGSESDTRKAAELGADAYLVKGRFEEDELLAVVERLGAGAAA